MFAVKSVVRRGLVVLAIALPMMAVGQQVETDTSVLSQENTGRLDGFSYRKGRSRSSSFAARRSHSVRKATAEVEFQDGRARVDVEVEKLPSPGKLGPFATYVLWAVTADGNANNIGAIETRDGRGELEASTPLSQFALIVTAEPHFAVTAPSRAMVLQNLAKNVRGGEVQHNRAQGAHRLLHAFSADARREARSSRGSRAGALRARHRRGCGRGAPGSAGLREGIRTSRQAEAAQEGDSASVRRDVPRMARAAVQTAEDTRRRAVDALKAEQKAAAAANAKQEAEGRAAVAAASAAEAAKRSEAQAAEESAMAASATERAAARADLVARLNRVLPTRETDRGIVAEIAGVQFAVGQGGPE